MHIMQSEEACSLQASMGSSCLLHWCCSRRPQTVGRAASGAASLSAASCLPELLVLKRVSQQQWLGKTGLRAVLERACTRMAEAVQQAVRHRQYDRQAGHFRRCQAHHKGTGRLSQYGSCHACCRCGWLKYTTATFTSNCH
jgi:hypothetical protein